MNRILIIGGTGNIGREVITQLTATRAQVRALVRNPDGARLPTQVEVMRGISPVRTRLTPAWPASIRYSWCGPLRRRPLLPL